MIFLDVYPWDLLCYFLSKAILRSKSLKSISTIGKEACFYLLHFCNYVLPHLPHPACDVVAKCHLGLIYVETLRIMLRRHHDLATGTSFRRTYFRCLCNVSLVREQNRTI